MNKYQKQKRKRMKRLINLGVGYYQAKSILRKFSFEQVDAMIDQVNELKNKKPGFIEKAIIAIKKSFENIKFQFNIAKELSNMRFKYKEIIKILIMGNNSPSLREFKVRAAATVEYKKKHKGENENWN